MAQIIEARQVPIEKIEIGIGQVRTRELSKGIDELADNIKKQGRN